MRLNLFTAAVAVLATLCGLTSARAQPVASAFEWTSLGGDNARAASRKAEVQPFGSPRWTLSQTSTGQNIRFVGPAGPVACTLPVPRLFVMGVISNQTYAIAINAETGALAWTTPIPALIFDSWSSPAIDARGGTVLFPTGTTIIALRIADGSEAWRATLQGAPVNVSAVVTSDLGLRNRAFVTDYGGFGGASWLYCINVSPRHEILNPYNPGEIVWTTSIGSSTGGTPSYNDGVVYACSTGLDGDAYGQIRAFDATATEPPQPLWIFSNSIQEGFFGGLTIHESEGKAYLYAATYAFYGQLDSANLVKVDAATGLLVWSTPCNRTDSIPVVLGDGRIVLSTGIQGFGSLPMVQMFQDHGASASHVWSTATSTWNDSNMNGVIEVGEFFLVGGWTTHPTVVRGATPGASPRLLVGSIPTGTDYFGPYTTLYELDLDRQPSQVGFVVQSTALAGSTPAMLGTGVYSVGTSGLSALGAAPPRGDLHADGRLTIDDLAAWEQNPISRDVDRNGVVDQADRAMLLAELRRNEHRNLLRDRSVRRP